MKRIQLCTLLAAFTVPLLCFHASLRADEGERISRQVAESAPDDGQPILGLGRFSNIPIHLTASLRAGYDDNVNLTSVNEQGSAFVSPSLALTYNFGNARTRLSLGMSGSMTYYADRTQTALNGISAGSNDYDLNGSLSFSVTHRATPRLTLAANIYATYQSQPNFDTFNRGGLGFATQNQNYFYSSNKIAATYSWAPKFQTATSYTLDLVDYSDQLQSIYGDRSEHTFSNEFRFLIWPTTTLVTEYRFGLIDYSSDISRDSTSHFLLGGFDHSFNPRFLLSARAGIELREYEKSAFAAFAESSRNSPYFEATANYSINKLSTISWTNRYSLEEPDSPNAFSRTTYRSALAVKYGFSQRITANVSFAYEHDNNEAFFGLGNFTETAIDASLGLRYSINRTWAIDAGYVRTQVFSETALREFSRNRIYGGVSLTF